MSNKRVWSGFHEKSIKERQEQLKLFYSFKSDILFNGLDPSIADSMIENCIGVMGVPLGISTNFKINGNDYLIPMAIDEPSVIAACSGAAKTISKYQGLKSFHPEFNMIEAQIQLLDVKNINEVLNLLKSKRDEIINVANTFCERMVKRGGGVRDVSFRTIITKVENIVIHLHINVCDSMGANCANTVAEGVAPFIRELTKTRIGLKILSNLSSNRLTTAQFDIPIELLEYKGFSGQIIAERIVEANDMALMDPFRAVTHNKGILNGIDAVAVATGQDWRAIESACHAYASGVGKSSIHPYQSLTSYSIQNNILHAELTLPLCVGTRGGITQSNPIYKYTLALLNNPDSKTLAMIMCCVGLIQNFAALRALVSEGIQRGHMSLHARNIALSAGCPPAFVAEVTQYMVQSNKITKSAAIEYLDAYEIHSKTLRTSLSNFSLSPTTNEKPNQKISMFIVHPPQHHENNEPGMEDFSIQIVFQSLLEKPILIELGDSISSSANETTYIKSVLFDSSTYDRLFKMTSLVETIRIASLQSFPIPKSMSRQNKPLQKKLKLISISLNVLLWKLIHLFPELTCDFITFIFESLNEQSQGNQIETISGISFMDYLNDKIIQNNIFIDENSSSDGVECSKRLKINDILGIGLPLFMSIWQVFEYRVDQWIGNSILKNYLISKQRSVIISMIETYSSYKNIMTIISSAKMDSNSSNSTTKMDSLTNFKSFFHLYMKRFQTCIFLLIDVLSLDEHHITDSVLSYLYEIGNHLDSNMAVAHDLSRYSRDSGFGNDQRINSLVILEKLIKTLSVNDEVDDNNKLFLEMTIQNEQFEKDKEILITKGKLLDTQGLYWKITDYLSNAIHSWYGVSLK